MTEELEQLLKNLKLRRMLNVYDEQLQAAEKAQASYSEFVAGLLRTQWHARQESALEWRIHRSESAGTLVARDVSVVAPARCEPQADAHVCRTRLCG